ncbi:MAG TPA: patatin-like phospholipase family protein [Steroidobacteraceae bacterium]|nr:patatin-like phospholipase family protein [Steroidobacteraceae bacterium]
MPAPAPKPEHRPRIGLVLSGGGARGIAHIGVLKVLEEQHIPIDAVAGTSMGAVVGGLYASGLTAREIESIMTSLNWQDAFRDRPPREDLTLRRKQEDENFLVKFPLGIKGGRFQLPKGLVQGQRLSQMLRRLTLPVARITNFDDLPTPFRALATDLETGDAVTLSSGDLTGAMRASMSVPGVFSPVERDGHLLVDGGISENLPIDIARSMGVDLLIVVDVGSPLLKRDKLNSVPVISNQMIAILVQKNTRMQLEKLQPQDIVIKPLLGDTSSFDFGNVKRVIAVGERAARAMTEQLASLAMTPKEAELYAQHRDQARQTTPPRIDFVQVDSGSRSYSERLNSLFDDLTGKPLDPDALARRVTTLYGEGSLDTLDYQVVEENDHYGLLLDARGNSIGPNYVRFGLSLQEDFQGNSTYDAAMRFVMSEITRPGGEFVWDMQVGQTSLIATEVFLPFSEFSGWFLDPHAQVSASNVPWFGTAAPTGAGSTGTGTTKATGISQNEIAQYRLHSYEYGIDFGKQFGNWGEIRTGIQREQGHSHLEIGDPNDPVLQAQPNQDFGVRDYFVRFSYDRLDDVNFPHSGQRSTLQWDAYRSVSGVDQVTNQVTFSYAGAISWGRDTAVFSANAGLTLDSTVNDVRLLYPLGGFLNLSGLRASSLMGPDFAIARVLLYRQIGRGGPGYFDVPTYVGVSFEDGNVWQSRQDMSFGNTHRDASIFLGMDTFLGPVYIATGFDEHGQQAFYLFLGRTF